MPPIFNAFFKVCIGGYPPPELVSELFYGVPHPTHPPKKAGGIKIPHDTPIVSIKIEGVGRRGSDITPAFFLGGAWGGVPHRKVPKEVPKGGTPPMRVQGFLGWGAGFFWGVPRVFIDALDR